MKKILQAIAGIAASCAIILSSLGIVSLAAGSATIAFSNKKPKVGEQVTVTVTLNAGEAMYSTEGQVSYDPAVLRFESGVSCSASGSQIRIIGDVDGDSRKSYQIVFTAVAASDSSVIRATMSYVNQSLTKSNDLGASAALAVVAGTEAPPAAEDNTPSANANLSSLTISKGSLSPKFSQKTTTYSASVENSVTKCTITAKTADAAATVSGAGEVSLSVGNNAQTITVTAANGTKKTYTLNIKRLQEGETMPTTSEPTEAGDGATPSGDPLSTLISGEGHHIVSDLTAIAVPNGFTASTAPYNGNEVGVFKDDNSNYTLYYLTRDADSTGDYYTYNATRDEFTRLPYLTLMGVTYIFAEVTNGSTAPEGYHSSSIKLGNGNITAYCANDEKLADFYIIYCYVNGNYKFYSYDMLEGTMQRAPGFKMGDAAEQTLPKEAGLLARFGALSATGKAVVIVLSVVALCIIALIILLILRITQSRKFANLSDDTDDAADLFRDDAFDEVDVSQAFQFDTTPKPSTPLQKPLKQPSSK